MRSSLSMSFAVAFALLIQLADSRPAHAQERADVPDAKKIAESRKLVQDLFKRDYINSKKWKELSEKLLKQAKEATGDPPARYALLDEARLMAAKSGNAATAVKAAELLMESFKVSRGKLWADIAEQIVDSTRTPIAAQNAAYLLITASDYAVAEEDWKSAMMIVRHAVTAARKARRGSLLKTAQSRATHIAKLKSEADKVAKHVKTLKTKPDDPDANLAVGRYLCLFKFDWKRGIPMLAKGSNESLKTAAGNDVLATAGVGDAKLTAADTWYDLSRKASKTEAPGMMVRAHYWYEQALPDLKSLKKIKAQKRLNELAPKVARLGGRAAAASKWAKIRQQIGKKEYTKTRIIGSAFNRKTYEEIPQRGALLIGFRYTVISNGKYPGFVQAIYSTSAGEVYGGVYGRPERGAKLYVTKAKPGYAVGAIYTRGGGGFDAFKPIYMKIKGDKLDTSDKYDGPHVGGMGGSSATLGGDGRFIIGLHGKLGRNGTIQALSPVMLGSDSTTTTKRRGFFSPTRPRRRP